MRLLTIEDLRKEGQGLGREQFLAKHTSPFLVLDQLGGDPDAEAFATVAGQGGRKLRANPLLKGEAPLPRTRVVSIKKRDGSNDFANMITIGRAGNNDILLEVSSVSKFHAYFTKDDGGRWHIHEAGSSNGTWIDGERLGESHGKAALRDGASIQLGPDARARFFEPKALYDILCSKKQPG